MSAASTPGSAPKAMSSRLLTMKFMQRAANASPTSNIFSSPDEPSLKRRRLDSDSSPLQKPTNFLADRATIQAALAQEETKRQAILDKQAAEAGDTRWVLNFEDQKHSTSGALRVIQTGFASLDASPSKIRIEPGEVEDKPVLVGRRSFGRFNKVLEKQQDPSYEDSEESDSDSDDDAKNESGEEGSDPDDPMSQLLRMGRQEAAERLKAERKAKKRAANEELEHMAKKRRKQDVNLNAEVSLRGLSSLSGRQENKGPQRKMTNVECFKCGGSHMMKDCPENTLECYNCGGRHFIKDCPEPRKRKSSGR